MLLLLFSTRATSVKFVWFVWLILGFVDHRFGMKAGIRSGFVQDVINLMTAVPWSDATSVTTGITGKNLFQLLLHYIIITIFIPLSNEVDTKHVFVWLFFPCNVTFSEESECSTGQNAGWTKTLSLRKLSQVWFNLDFRWNHTVMSLFILDGA